MVTCLSNDSNAICDELIIAAMESNEAFAARLKLAIRQLGISAKELSTKSGVPLSTINKITSQNRDLRCSTLRDLLTYLRSASSQGADITIGIIATRQSLDDISKHQLVFGTKKILLKEYPASGVEDVMTSAIRAEKEKVQGIVCASIVANMIEKFINVPIMAVKIDERSILDAVSLLVEKISST